MSEESEWYVKGCCAICRTEYNSHRSVMLHKCSGCGKMLKVHKDATDKDIADLRYAIRQLVHGNFRVI
jgi:hypothetical protein